MFSDRWEVWLDSFQMPPVLWPITMKKKLVLLLPICLGGCSLEEYKAKKHIIDTKWSCIDTTYIPPLLL